MSNWTDTLSSLGARFHIDEAAQVEDFGRALSAAELADGFVATVTDLGIIAVAGEDAASFLHNQLTNDVEHLGLAKRAWPATAPEGPPAGDLPLLARCGRSVPAAAAHDPAAAAETPDDVRAAG